MEQRFHISTIICNNSPFPLNAGNSGTSWLWKLPTGSSLTDSTNQLLIPDFPGSYSVKVNLNGCESFDTIFIDIRNAPVINLGNDTTVCEGTPLLLDVTTSTDAFGSGPAYLWQDNSSSPKFSPSQTNKYVVHITRGVCHVSDSVKITFMPKPVFTLGTMTDFCFNDPVLFDFTSLVADSYLWQDNSTLPYFTATGPGNYKLEIKKSVCTVSDSITLAQKPLPLVDLGNDTSICKENQVVLNAKNDGSTFLWNNLSTDQSILVGKGTYKVTVTNAQGCYAKDSIIVDTLTSPYPSLGNDFALCKNQSYTLSPSTDFVSYVWNNGSTQKQISISAPGIYSVTVKDLNNCSGFDEIQLSTVDGIDIPLQVIRLCSPDTLLQLPAAFESYQWQDGSFLSVYHVTDFGNYYVIVTDANACIDTAAFDVVNSCEPLVYTPNAFTPNGDAVNELFIPVAQNVNSIHFEIYNRWGQLVFSTDKLNEGWNGKVGNEFQPADVYCFKGNYIGSSGETHHLNGTFTLLR